MDAVDEQRLGSVHVADTAHHLLLEQQLPDRRDTSNDRLVRQVRLCVVAQRVRTESAHDPIAIFGRADRAVGRTGEIDGCLRNRQAHAHRRRVVGCAAAVHAELAEQAEVDVTDQPVAPQVEEVLAVGLDPSEASAVDERRVGCEATLRRRNGDVLAAEHLRMIDGDSVNGVTLGHADRDVTGTLGAS